jgi:hypothetical protein
MTSSKLPTGISALLRSFEQRLLWLLLVFGVGQILLTAGSILILLYGLDRLFQPPAWFRLVLLALALFYLVRASLRSLWRPLSQRPEQHDLAALLERHHPGLRDLLATAVERDVIHPNESPQLKQAVAERAELAVAKVDLRTAAPSGTARRSAFRGSALSVALLAMALLAPTEAGIFFQRLVGKDVAWPQQTQLLMLAPYSASSGESLDLTQLDSNHYELHVSRGTTVNLRVRAEGEVPEQVFAMGSLGKRAMQPMGGGEFVLRLPSVDVDSSWSFIGGDDEDGSPFLDLRPGNPPAITDWQVTVNAPEYTGLAQQVSQSNEFRVPQNSRMTLDFAADLPVAKAWMRRLDGTREELVAADGSWSYPFTAETSGEFAFELEGTDGFLNRHAGMLRWTAEPDHAPRINFLFPDRRWTTVSEAKVPLLFAASDDYGLNRIELSLSDQGEPWTPEFKRGARDWNHFELITAPLPSAEGFGADYRMRVEATAHDFAEPFAQAGDGTSPWIQVLSAASFEQNLAEQMVRVRERVADQMTRLQPLLADQAPGSQEASAAARRIDRELDGLLRDLEYALLERIYSGLDRSSGGLQAALNQVVELGPPAPGATIDALSAPGVPPVLDRAGLLMQLAKTARSTKQGPSQALRAATAAGSEYGPAAADLQDGLQTMLDALLAWEDYQSAVNLLRGLLDRQRGLYLRTLEASGR